MKKFISYEKMSKKAKREFDAQKRRPFAPMTKVVKAKKGGKYDRQKNKRSAYDTSY